MTDSNAGMSRHALVVDDDPHINRLLQVRLRSAGFEVRSAVDGEHAVEQIEASPPDLMLLDVSMPGMGGLDVLRWIRERRLDIAVIMSTAFGSEQVAIEALRLGADDYLRKPFETTEFKAVVERTASRLFLRRENEALRRQLNAELLRAAEIQASLLPPSPPTLDGYDVAAICHPAREVGGDFYDWQMLPDGSLSVLIGDVMGKGMPAALLMATVRAALRPVLAMQGPADGLRQVEAALTNDLERSGSFVTLFVARLDPSRHAVEYVDAGHGLAVVTRADGRSTNLATRSLPLGVFPGMDVQHETLELDPGDALILYSDGLVDSLPGACLSPGELASHVAGAGSAEAIAGRLAALIPNDTPYVDDVTVTVLRRETGSNP